MKTIRMLDAPQRRTRAHVTTARRALLVCVIVFSAGCASVINRASQTFADNLTAGILGQDDIEIARQGIPAYLLLIDGLIDGDPQNAGMLLAGARLYGAYAGGFIVDPQRSRTVAERGFGYARRATCIRDKNLCRDLDGPFDALTKSISQAHDVPLLFTLASSWATRIQSNSGDWNAIADIPKVQALLERVVALDPTYAHGDPYLYLGVLDTLRPASLGGEPEKGKAAFEKALALSGGNNQMVRVLYAEKYARLVFDQPLHDRLLNEAIKADPHLPGMTLINVLAQQRAKALLASGKDYF